MSKQQQPKEHCTHEKGCPTYIESQEAVSGKPCFIVCRQRTISINTGKQYHHCDYEFDLLKQVADGQEKEIIRLRDLLARSRPHPAPAPCPYSADDDMCHECKAHEERIARQAREDVLDDICQNCGGLADGGEQCKTCYVKSLRHSTQEPPR